MMHLLLGLIPHALKEKVKRKMGVPDMFASMERLKRSGFNPKNIVDVGAYEGKWTETCMQVFPAANYFMFEANSQKEAALKKISGKYNGQVKYYLNCLGSKAGEEVTFHVMETASSVLDEFADNQSEVIVVKTETLDNTFNREGIDKIDFIKLDVQGYELEILKGFTGFLPVIEVILLEVSLLDIHKGVPLLHDVVGFMYQFGFVAYDICSVTTRRPLDNALWQTDLLFVKEQSIFRNDKRYNA